MVNKGLIALISGLAAAGVGGGVVYSRSKVPGVSPVIPEILKVTSTPAKIILKKPFSLNVSVKNNGTQAGVVEVILKEVDRPGIKKTIQPGQTQVFEFANLVEPDRAGIRTVDVLARYQGNKLAIDTASATFNVNAASVGGGGGEQQPPSLPPAPQPPFSLGGFAIELTEGSVATLHQPFGFRVKALQNSLIESSPLVPSMPYQVQVNGIVVKTGQTGSDGFTDETVTFDVPSGSTNGIGNSIQINSLDPTFSTSQPVGITVGGTDTYAPVMGLLNPATGGFALVLSSSSVKAGQLFAFGIKSFDNIFAGDAGLKGNIAYNLLKDGEVAATSLTPASGYDPSIGTVFDTPGPHTLQIVGINTPLASNVETINVQP